MKKKEIKIIDITLKSLEDAKSIYNDNTLSEELSNYIYKECLGINIKKSFKIRIKPYFKITEKEKDELVTLIRSNFGLDIQEKLIHRKRENIKQALLFVIGIFFIFLSNLVHLESVFIMNEVLLIAGWVQIWEAVYSIFFVDTSNNYSIKRLKQLTTCKIEFI